MTFTAPVDLPAPVTTALDALIEATRTAFGDHLISIVLHGSAAEGRLRATSDVNVIFVLRAVERERVDGVLNALRLARATANVRVMMIVESEIASAAAAFAIKFADIARRHRVLLGPDPFERLDVPRSAVRAQLDQMLLNLQLRLREAYAVRGLREEQLARAAADAAAPLRACASAILTLEGRPVPSPREALAQVVGALNRPELGHVPGRLSEARNAGVLPPGVAGPLLFDVMALAEALRARAHAVAS